MNGAISVNVQTQTFQAQTHHNRECRTPLRNNLVSRPLQLELRLVTNSFESQVIHTAGWGAREGKRVSHQAPEKKDRDVRE